MRILLISQYFAPEITAAPLRLRPLAAGLAARGHEVEVISEVPSHPQGVRYPGFAARPVQRRQMDGFRVSYVWASAARSKRPLSRIAAYASYAASATVAGAAAARPDVVFASSPPLSVGLVAEIVARRHRVPWVFDVRDLWPQVAGELGSVSSSRALAAAAALERRLYRSATGITTATEPFRAHISDFVAASRVLVLPNGTTRAWIEVGEGEPDRAAAALPADRFVWTYAGNVGLSQGLEVAVEAARRLGPGFRLLILGDGASRPRLRELAAGVEPGSIEFRDPIPPEQAAVVMRASDALLVSLADMPALGKTVPVKFYDSAALGRPVVVSAPGEPRRIAEETGAGIAVAPGDAAALAAAVRQLDEDAELGERLGRAGRAFAAANLREDGILRLEAFLEEVAGR
jgi:putative colanic acid biosynthesis glycosyltransferase WcaI